MPRASPFDTHKSRTDFARKPGFPAYGHHVQGNPREYRVIFEYRRPLHPSQLTAFDDRVWIVPRRTRA